MCNDRDRFSVMLIPSQEPTAVDLPHLSPTHVDRSVSLCPLLPKINDQLLGFADVEQ